MVVVRHCRRRHRHHCSRFHGAGVLQSIGALDRGD